jgi:hypothetical protein
MVDLTRRIAAEKENVERALCDLRVAVARKNKSTIEPLIIEAFVAEMGVEV